MKQQGCGQKTAYILSKIFCPCRTTNQTVDTIQDDENYSNNTTTKEMNRKQNFEDVMESDFNFRTSQCEQATLANSQRVKQNQAAGFVHRTKNKKKKKKDGSSDDAFYSETMPYQKQIQEVEFQKLISSSPGSSLNNTFCYDRVLEEGPAFRKLIVPSKNIEDSTLSQTKNLTQIQGNSGFTPNDFHQQLTDKEIQIKPDRRPDLMRKRSSKQSKQSLSNVLKNQGLVSAEQFVAMSRDSQEQQIQKMESLKQVKQVVSEKSINITKNFQPARSRLSNNVAKVSIPSMPTEEDKEEVPELRKKSNKDVMGVRPNVSKRNLPHPHLIPSDKFKLEGPTRNLTKSPMLNLLAPRTDKSNTVLKTMPEPSKPSSMSQASNISASAYKQKQASILNKVFQSIAQIEVKNSSKDFSYNAVISHPKVAKVRNPYLKKSKTTINQDTTKIEVKRRISDNIIEDIEFESSSISSQSDNSVSSRTNSRLDTEGSRVINIENGQRRVTMFSDVGSEGSPTGSVTHSTQNDAPDELSLGSLALKKPDGDTVAPFGLSTFAGKKARRPRRDTSSSSISKQ